MNQKLGRRARQDRLTQTDLWAIEFKRAKINSLSDDERFAFALLAQIFHDFNTLRKLLLICQPRRTGAAHERAAAVSQVMMMTRTFVGYVFEARLALEKAQGKLRKTLFVHMPTAADRWKALSAIWKSMSWMSKVRNAHCFHYPEFSQVASELRDHWPPEGGMVAGPSLATTFFNEPAQAMMLAMFLSSGLSTSWPVALRQMLEESIELCAAILQFVGDLLQAFVHAQLQSGEPKPLANFDAPAVDEIYLPYFAPPDKTP